MKTASHASPAEFFTALKFQNSAIAFPEENHSHEGCVAGTTFVSAKGALPRELGESKARQRCVNSMEAKLHCQTRFFLLCPFSHGDAMYSVAAMGWHFLPRFREEPPNADSGKLVRRRIVTHKKRPAARQDVSLREISTGGESALLQEPAADFQTGFFPDWPRSARPSARSPSDCSGRSGSRKSCRGRRPAQGRAF